MSETWTWYAEFWFAAIFVRLPVTGGPRQTNMVNPNDYVRVAFSQPSLCTRTVTSAVFFRRNSLPIGTRTGLGVSRQRPRVRAVRDGQSNERCTPRQDPRRPVARGRRRRSNTLCAPCSDGVAATSAARVLTITNPGVVAPDDRYAVLSVSRSVRGRSTFSFARARPPRPTRRNRRL